MMVIQGNLPANTFGSGTNNNTELLQIPADRCVWGFSADTSGNGYDVLSAYYIGAGTTHVIIANPRLGFIGKSGRFVAMTT